MKYIKKFEGNNDYEIYWKISIEKYYYEISLKKIGIPDDIYDYWITEVPKQFKRNEYDEIFIFEVFHKDDGTITWCWEELDYKYFKNSKYMGRVYMTEEELKLVKMKQESEKYNI